MAIVPGCTVYRGHQQLLQLQLLRVSTYFICIWPAAFLTHDQQQQHRCISMRVLHLQLLGPRKACRKVGPDSMPGTAAD